MGIHTVQMQRVLGTPALVAFGLAYMVPLTIFTTYGEVTVLSEGHLPVAYIITLATMIFTALSYCKMTSTIPLAGSAYSYVQKTFGNKIGFVVGWAQVLDYLFLPMINHLMIGIYMHDRFPVLPISTVILTSIALVTFLNILGMKLITSVNFILIVAQFIFIGLLLAFSFSTIDFTPETLLKPLLVNSDHEISGLLTGAAMLCLAFLGFDAIATMTEEARDAKKTVPRAILLTVLIAGIIFLVISYVTHLAYPNWENFKNNPDTASLVVITAIAGKFMGDFFLAAYLSGVFTSAMSAQASVSRILFAMGREGVLPKKIFFNLNKRFHTPHFSILFVSLLSLSALFISVSLAVSMISFGALVAFTFVNLSVIKHFIINEKMRGIKTLLQCGLLPLIGVLLCLWLWTSLNHLAIKIGVAWLIIGLLYLMFLTRGFKKEPPSVSEEEYNDLINH